MDQKTFFMCAAGAALCLVFMPPARAAEQNCRSAAFSPEVMARFPRVREACLEVIDLAGNSYAVFRARLDRVSGNTMRVRFQLPDGSSAQAQDIRTKPDFRVLVDGERVRVEELAVGQDLTAYVRVREPLVALAPAVATEPLEVVPLAAVPVSLATAEPRMPETASLLPGTGLMAMLLLGLAGGVRTLRRRMRW